MPSEDTISTERRDHWLRVLFQELKAVGGPVNGSDVLAAIEKKLELTPYERGLTTTGAVRWETHLRFHTTDCVKSGYLKKSNGKWSLTERGATALTLPPGELFRSAVRGYREWQRSQKGNEDGADSGNGSPPVEAVNRLAVYEQAKEQARKEIDQHLDAMGPYDFQRVVGELLKAMGYHVPYTAPPGPDGGVDVIAYRDPLGTTAPRIKVQVKHRESKVQAKDVREMEGLLRKEGDIGLVVSSGGFTADAERELRSSTRHIETMDQDRLISLWQEHYEKLSEAGKALLPLRPVYFLAPDEE